MFKTKLKNMFTIEENVEKVEKPRNSTGFK